MERVLDFIWLGPQTSYKFSRAHFHHQKKKATPDQCSSVGWALSHKATGFQSTPGHTRIPTNFVGSIPRQETYKRCLSHIYVCLPLFFPPFPSKNK